jgi:type III secretion protein V
MNQATALTRTLGSNAVLTALQKIPSRIEAILAMAVVAVIFLLVLPIPAPVMDVLIACNLFLSCLLLSLSLYVTGITAFSTFPVVLLLSTLFRLGISVATTRLILLDGHAGSIVDTFGNFVVGGEVLVGLVIFIIVTVVQFLVVTKGAERVAEVSARFCLDAMPAKQLAIENELRANLIDQAEAKRQRSQVSTESQLLGAMDGAMKFVKGDAIAGMVIVVVNLLGGLASGLLTKGMNFSQAVAHYSVQTVGDGLVAQIPALLTCLTAAILVTRVDSATKPGKDEKARTFGGDLLGQLGAYPKALWGLSMVMVVFALIPGMPAAVFICLAIAAAAAAYFSAQFVQGQPAAGAKGSARNDATDAEVVHEFTQVEQLQLAFPADKGEDLESAQALSQEITRARNDLVKVMGMSMPAVTYPRDEKLPSDVLELRVYEIPMTRLPYRPDDVAIDGRDAARAAELPGAFVEEGAGASGTNVVWLHPATLVAHEDLQRVAVPWVKALRHRVYRKLLRYAPRFTGVQTAQRYMTWMEAWMPELAKELQKNISTSKLADVAQRLLREGVSIRNMRLIMETLADVGQREREPAVLTEFVRYALREQLCHELAHDRRLDVFVLAPELEEMLTQSIRQGAGGSFLALSPEDSARVIDAVRNTLIEHQLPGEQSVIVCAQDIRRFVRTMLEPDLPDLVVLALSELSPEVGVVVRATVERPEELSR